MGTFAVTFNNVLVTLLYLSAGFLLAKGRKVNPDHMGSVSAILLYICGPCMFLNALTALDRSPSMTADVLLFFAVTLVLMVLAMLIVFGVLGRRRREFPFRMMALATVMGNVGFFGLPIVSSLFPDAPEAAAFSCIFTASMNIIAWTLGVFVITGDRKYMSARAALLNPTVISVALGFVLYLAGAKNWLPGLLSGGIRTVGGISTPLSMFVLGIRLSTMDLKSLFTQRVPWLASFGKLVAFPLFSYLLVFFLPLSPVLKASVLILSGTPCASIILNFSEMYHNGQKLAANCALLSTLLSIVTIPLLSLLL